MQRCPGCRRAITSPEWRCDQCGWEAARREGWPSFAPELADGTDGFRAEFFETLFDAESHHFWFQSRNALLAECLKHGFPRARRMLEIGCGTGYVLAGLRAACPDLQYAGSEVFTEGLVYAARRLPGVELFQMDARRIPFDAAFDVVGAFDVLEHIAEDEVVLAEMFRTVKPGGGVLITVPQHMWLWSDADDRSCHKRRYARGELTAKLQRAGFTNIRTHSFVSLLLPLLWARRLRRSPGGDPAGREELAIGPWANAVGRHVMTIERAWVTRGWSLPWGGSLLAIAHRPER
jgi:SAM-dependent methyltransferase